MPLLPILRFSTNPNFCFLLEQVRRWPKCPIFTADSLIYHSLQFNFLEDKFTLHMYFPVNFIVVYITLTRLQKQKQTLKVKEILSFSNKSKIIIQTFVVWLFQGSLEFDSIQESATQFV